MKKAGRWGPPGQGTRGTRGTRPRWRLLQEEAPAGRRGEAALVVARDRDPRAAVGEGVARRSREAGRAADPAAARGEIQSLDEAPAGGGGSGSLSLRLERSDRDVVAAARGEGGGGDDADERPGLEGVRREVRVLLPHGVDGDVGPAGVRRRRRMADLDDAARALAAVAVAVARVLLLQGSDRDVVAGAGGEGGGGDDADEGGGLDGVRRELHVLLLHGAHGDLDSAS